MALAFGEWLSDTYQKKKCAGLVCKGKKRVCGLVGSWFQDAGYGLEWGRVVREERGVGLSCGGGGHEGLGWGKGGGVGGKGSVHRVLPQG